MFMAQSESAKPTKRRPLEGVRVIDLTKIVAGPNATRMLATMGAEVIRVEWHDQRALDLLRGVQPKAPGGEPDSLNRSGLFNNINPGKYGVTLNMSLPQGRDLFKRFIAKASVVCENYSPGQMDRWELGYDVLRQINPELIYLQISGMGKSGTYNDYLSVGPTAQALVGFDPYVRLARANATCRLGLFVSRPFHRLLRGDARADGSGQPPQDGPRLLHRSITSRDRAHGIRDGYA